MFQLLNQADTNVQVLLQETGEHVLLTAGEVHLERCLKDLEEFAQVPIIASDPIVPYRETIISRPKLDRTNELIVNAKKAEIYAQVSDPLFSLKFSAKPLPKSIYTFLLDNSDILKTVDRLLRQEIELSDLINEAKTQLETFAFDLEEVFDSESSFSSLKNKIWAFGPNRVGANILFNQCSGYERPSLLDLVQGKASFDQLRESDSSISHGFQLATSAGLLCEEPLIGVAIFVHDFTTNNSATSSAVEHGSVTKDVSEDAESLKLDSHSGAGSSVSCFTAISGKLISSTRETIRKAIQVCHCYYCFVILRIYFYCIFISVATLPFDGGYVQM